MASLSPRIDRLDRNFIVNGNFDFWQRGTSGFTGLINNGYGADRWRVTAGTEAYSQGTSTPPDGSKYYAIITRTTASSGSLSLNQRFESNFVRGLSGKTVTLSFQARQTSGSTTPIKIRVDSADAVDNFGAVTIVVPETSILANPTSSWQKVVYTFTVTSTMATNGFQIVLGNLVTTGPVTFNFAQVQLIEGTHADPEFTTAGRNYAEELMLCQRYYQRGFNNKGVYGAYSTGNVATRIPLHNAMRAVPSVTQISGTSLTNAIDKLGAGPATPSAVSAGGISTQAIYADWSMALTLYQPCSINTDILQADAEL